MEEKRFDHNRHISRPEEEERVRKMLEKNREQELQHAAGYDASRRRDKEYETFVAERGGKSARKPSLDELEKHMH